MEVSTFYHNFPFLSIVKSTFIRKDFAYKMVKFTNLHKNRQISSSHKTERTFDRGAKNSIGEGVYTIFSLNYCKLATDML